MNRSRRHAIARAVAIVVTAVLGFGLGAGPGCAPPGGPRAPAHPTNPDAELLFASLSDARARRNARPPTWMGSLERVAREGAARLATGALGRSVAHEVSSKAAYSAGRNVMVWYFVVDDLHGIDWPPELLSGGGMLVSIGVALMQTTAPGRYAVIVILPETGPALSG